MEKCLITHSNLLALVALLVMAFASAATAGEAGNIAPKAKISVSSTREPYVKGNAIDGDMLTQWSTAHGETTGQWLQLDWDEPQKIAGIVLYQTGRWAESLDVQVEQGGAWVTVGSAGSVKERTPIVMQITFKQVTSRSLKLDVRGGVAFYEVEVYPDAQSMQKAVDEIRSPDLSVAGDTRGGLVGVLSSISGFTGVRDTEIIVSGASPLGPWQRSARTGEGGVFRVELPPVITGDIKATAHKGESEISTTVNSGDISQRLTLLPADSSRRMSLNGNWDFAVDPPKDFPKAVEVDRNSLKWSNIKVPAHWEMEGFTAESGRAVYRRTFIIPAAWAGKRIKLRAEAIYSHADVWINGRRIGGHEGGATPFELDYTDVAKPGKPNNILVLVTARSRASTIDNASFFAMFELAGIWQSIETFCVDPVHISRCAIDTTFDAVYRDANLAVNLDIRNDQKEPVNGANIKLKLFDPKGKQVALDGLSTSVSLDPWDRRSATLKAKVSSPQQWNAEQPSIYRLRAELSIPGQGTHVIEQSFGFREIEIKGGRTYMINGKPVKLRGIVRLEAHPLMGRALTPEINKQDVEMIKGANFNAVRACIFPPHSDFLDWADREGLYIENEGPTCWGNNANDYRYAALYMGIMSEFVERDRNHPSVIDWSMCNESEYGPVFSLAGKLVKEIDPSRTISATWGDDTLELATLHHPITLDRVKETTGWSKPVFFDEVITVFHGWEDLALFLDIDPGMRDYWVTGLPEITRAVNDGDNQLGAMQFSWSDDAFCVPGRQIGTYRRNQAPVQYTESVYKLPGRGMVGDVPWGTVDGWRRPRPEYWLSKKVYSPVQIEEKPLSIPAQGQPISVHVENWNQFANLDQYVCKWRLGDEKGVARVSAAPMGKGILEIASKRQPTRDDVLVLEFYDESERMVDGYRLAFKPHEIPVLPNSGKPARFAEQNVGMDGYLDGASAVRMIGHDFELAYDRTGGELYRALAGGENVLISGPTLHLQKDTEPMEAFPTGSRTGFPSYAKSNDTRGISFWDFKNADYHIEGGQAVLNWNGSYGSQFTGGYQIRMDDAGDIEIRYEFKYNGADVWVREIGLRFGLPMNFDILQWDRRAEYSYYPNDHIGRPVGAAVAHPAVPQTIPAETRPYGLDDHPWGCNDFRSTKRNIYSASLTNKRGEGIKVISDGTQHVRASVGLHEIVLRVLDFYGGSGAPNTWSTIGFHYGPGHNLKTGEVLKGTVKLQLLKS